MTIFVVFLVISRRRKCYSLCLDIYYRGDLLFLTHLAVYLEVGRFVV